MQQPQSKPVSNTPASAARPATPASRPVPLPLDADLLRHVSGGGAPKGIW